MKGHAARLQARSVSSRSAADDGGVSDGAGGLPTCGTGQALQQEHDKAEQLARELATAWRGLRFQATAVADNAAQDQQLTELRQVLQQGEAAAYWRRRIG